MLKFLCWSCQHCNWFCDTVQSLSIHVNIDSTQKPLLLLSQGRSLMQIIHSNTVLVAILWGHNGSSKWLDFFHFSWSLFLHLEFAGSIKSHLVSRDSPRCPVSPITVSIMCLHRGDCSLLLCPLTENALNASLYFHSFQWKVSTRLYQVIFLMNVGYWISVQWDEHEK